jgi:hypothetical protein
LLKIPDLSQQITRDNTREFKGESYNLKNKTQLLCEGIVKKSTNSESLNLTQMYKKSPDGLYKLSYVNNTLLEHHNIKKAPLNKLNLQKENKKHTNSPPTPIQRTPIKTPTKKSPSTFQSRPISDKYIFLRLERDLSSILSSSLINGLISGKASYSDFVSILFQMGFLNSMGGGKNTIGGFWMGPEEGKLVAKMWRHLKEESSEYVRVDNLKVYLAAVLGLNIPVLYEDEGMARKCSRYTMNDTDRQAQQSADKYYKSRKRYSEDMRKPSDQRHIQHRRTPSFQSSTSQSTTRKIPFDSIGYFSPNGRFYFKNSLEVTKIHKYFKLLSEQRNEFIRGSSRSPRSSSNGSYSLIHKTNKPNFGTGSNSQNIKQFSVSPTKEK